MIVEIFMKSPKEILTWLKINLGPRSLGGLTSTDTHALITSVNLSNLISYPSAPPELFRAWRDIVSQMLPHNRHLAFHAIAIELDWSHRRMIWTQAFTISGVLQQDVPTNVCCFEPGGGGQARSEELRRQK
jgi:hypothetical protein